MTNIGRGITACAAITVLATTLVVCRGDGGESVAGKESTADDGATALSEAVALEFELQGTVVRLGMECVAEQGFDVHPRWLTEVLDPDSDRWELLGADPPEFNDVPTAKDAAKQGFGVPLGRPEPDEPTDPFTAETQKYQTGYNEALFGRDWAQILSESSGIPPDAGCMGEILVAVYGTEVHSSPMDPSAATQARAYGISPPAQIDDRDRRMELYETEELRDSRDKLSKCIGAAGYPYFEYHKDSGFDTYSYAYEFYDDGVESTDNAELPEGAPWKDYGKAFAAEVAFATAVAQCADDTGFRKTMNSAWRDSKDRIARDNEKVLFAWRDELETALEIAQDLLGEK